MGLWKVDLKNISKHKVNPNLSILELDDLYDCEKCKRKSKASKKMTLTKSPNYLMIVLKKFTLSGKKI